MSLLNVKLPDIGEGVTEGELVKWLVQIGDVIKVDQAVAEVMTDKATVEVPSPLAGKVKEFKFKEGDAIPIETIMLILEGEGASAPSSPEPIRAETKAGDKVGAKMASASTAPVSSEALDTVTPPAAESNVLATPATRRLARETGVDINQLSGSGMAGRVTRDDVTKAQGASHAPSAPAAATTKNSPVPSPVRMPVVSAPGAADERVPLRGVRKKIAENLQMAKQIIPHFTLMEEVCVDALVETRSQAKAAAEKYGVKVTYLPFVMKALISACREFPMFNASIDDQASEIVYKKNFNLGFAADTPSGLMVPVIKNADQKTILQLGQEIQSLAAKARDGKLGLDEMRGATITVTNLGSVGGVYATPIINHPEVAILGVYRIQDKPRWTGTEFVRSQTMNFTVTCDHRLIDGAVAANFMRSFKERIENPARLLLEMV